MIREKIDEYMYDFHKRRYKNLKKCKYPFFEYTKLGILRALLRVVFYFLLIGSGVLFSVLYEELSFMKWMYWIVVVSLIIISHEFFIEDIIWKETFIQQVVEKKYGKKLEKKY